MYTFSNGLVASSGCIGGGKYQPPQPPDSFHLWAAEGWLRLGNHLEASKELEKVAPQLQAHPVALIIRWEIDAGARNWAAALDIATALTQILPEAPLGWINRSFSLHELNRTSEARDNLLGVVDKFPACGTLKYNLALYEYQLGRVDQARHWLEKSLELGGDNQMN